LCLLYCVSFSVWYFLLTFYGITVFSLACYNLELTFGTVNFLFRQLVGFLS